MFALLALVCFVLASAGVEAPLDLVPLGLAFVAGHLLLGTWPLGHFTRKA